MGILCKGSLFTHDDGIFMKGVENIPIIFSIFVNFCRVIKEYMGDYYWGEFFDSSREYFFSKKESFENKRKISFNIHAFLFGFLWFLYRKMFRQALMFLGGFILASLLESLILGDRLLHDTTLIWIVNASDTLFFALIAGFFGNWIYLNHVKKELGKIREKSEGDEDYRMKLIRQKGGTSHMLVITVLIVILLSQVLSNSMISE